MISKAGEIRQNSIDGSIKDGEIEKIFSSELLIFNRETRTLELKK